MPPAKRRTNVTGNAIANATGNATTTQSLRNLKVWDQQCQHCSPGKSEILTTRTGSVLEGAARRKFLEFFHRTREMEITNLVKSRPSGAWIFSL